ncbi:MAG: hypothetical protein J6Q89_08790 [Clostridia bacterium]|nr:hypothetical protein [Clostridia bacterium]
MPKLNDHGLGGGGKSIGVPVYPYVSSQALREDLENGTIRELWGDNTATAPVNVNIYEQASCVIGDEMYFIGNNTSYAECYKYNVKTKSWTKLSDSPDANAKNWAEAIGTDIYYGAYNYIYKYDTLNDTHSSMGTFRRFKDSRSCTDGTYIYISGGNETTSMRSLMEKYDPTNNTITDLTDSPVPRYKHCMIYGGDGYIYIFGGTGSLVTAYKYSIAEDKHAALAEIPFNYQNGMIAKVYDYIYLINSSSSNSTLCRYDMLDDTYRTLSATPTYRYYGHAGVIDNVIYMIGGAGGNTSGDTMLVTKVTELSVAILNLPSGCRCYTDGDVIDGEMTNFGGYNLLTGGSTLGKVNGVVSIPDDGDYIIVDGTYLTTGG